MPNMLSLAAICSSVLSRTDMFVEHEYPSVLISVYPADEPPWIVPVCHIHTLALFDDRSLLFEPNLFAPGSWVPWACFRPFAHASFLFSPLTGRMSSLQQRIWNLVPPLIGIRPFLRQRIWNYCFPNAMVMVMLMVMLMDVLAMLYLMVHEHILISRFDENQFPNLVIWFPVVCDPR